MLEIYVVRLNILYSQEMFMKLRDISLDEGHLRNLALAGSLLGAGLGIGSHMNKEAPTKSGAYQKAFHNSATESLRQQRQDKFNRVKNSGSNKGTFIGGELQDEDDEEIESYSATSDDAADYLK